MIVIVFCWVISLDVTSTSVSTGCHFNCVHQIKTAVQTNFVIMTDQGSVFVFLEGSLKYVDSIQIVGQTLITRTAVGQRVVHKFTTCNGETSAVLLTCSVGVGTQVHSAAMEEDVAMHLM